MRSFWKIASSENALENRHPKWQPQQQFPPKNYLREWNIDKLCKLCNMATFCYNAHTYTHLRWYISCSPLLTLYTCARKKTEINTNFERGRYMSKKKKKCAESVPCSSSFGDERCLNLHRSFLVFLLWMRQMAHKRSMREWDKALHGVCIYETKQKWTNYCQRLKADIVNEKIMIVLHGEHRTIGMGIERAIGRRWWIKDTLGLLTSVVRRWADLVNVKDTHDGN